MKTPAEPDDGQLKLRLPLSLKDWLSDKATENRRSLNNEVVVRLQESRKREAKAQKVKPQ